MSTPTRQCTQQMSSTTTGPADTVGDVTLRSPEITHRV